MRNEKPTLIIMAAGLGSRYGGDKQLDEIGPRGEIIADYAIRDAYAAGIDHVVMVIREEMEPALRAHFAAEHAHSETKIEFAYQHMDDIPAPFGVPDGRTKPWGTGHAIYAARRLARNAFIVINADDYYGAEPYKRVADALSSKTLDSAKETIYLAGYRLRNTLTEHGFVSRGVLRSAAEGQLLGIDERTKIYRDAEGVIVYEEDGITHPLAEDAQVSMNFWGFPHSFMSCLEDGLKAFLNDLDYDTPEALTKEFYLPSAVSQARDEGLFDVCVLPTDSSWLGVTYKEDRAQVSEALAGNKII